MSVLSLHALAFGFSQGFVIGPLSLYGIREGLNPKRGFLCQLQVIAGATIVDVIYLLLATYGMAGFVQYDLVQVVLFSLASYMLITMGVNSLHEKPGKLSFAHLHRHKLLFFETDFFRAFCMNLVNPMVIIFAVVVFGGMYADYSAELSPLAFTLNIVGGGLLTSILIAFSTLAIRHIFHQWMLKKLMKAGSLILVAYGLWFFWKAAQHVPDLTVSLIHFVRP